MRKIVMFVIFVYVITFGMVIGQEIQLHPQAEKYPVPYAGPFVMFSTGEIVSLSGTEAHRSTDGGKTWLSSSAVPTDKYIIGDYSIVRTKDDTIIAVFCNNKEIRRGKWGEGSPTEWEIPIYSIRSLDHGKTWSSPLPIQRDWVGALRGMVVLKNGRIVLAAMAVKPWEHIIPVYYSEDQGQSWKKTATITMEGSHINDHDGAMEPKLIELNNGSIFMLIRTTKGTFYKSISNDGGLTWSKPESTGIQNNNSFGELARLADGRLILIWNRDDKYPPFDYQPDPKDWIVQDQSYSWIRRRNKLSVAFSSDDGQTWTPPIVIAQTANEKTWIAYSVFFEPQPGVFWIATQQGNVRLMIKEENCK